MFSISCIALANFSFSFCSTLVGTRKTEVDFDMAALDSLAWVLRDSDSFLTLARLGSLVGCRSTLFDDGRGTEAGGVGSLFDGRETLRNCLIGGSLFGADLGVSTGASDRMLEKAMGSARVRRDSCCGCGSLSWAIASRPGSLTADLSRLPFAVGVKVK